MPVHHGLVAVSSTHLHLIRSPPPWFPPLHLCLAAKCDTQPLSPFITPSTLCSWIPFSVSSIWGCRLTESCDTRNRFWMAHQEPSTHWRIGNTFLTVFQGKRSHLLLYSHSKHCLTGHPQQPALLQSFWSVFKAVRPKMCPPLTADGVHLPYHLGCHFFSTMLLEWAVVFRGSVVFVEVIFLIFSRLLLPCIIYSASQ